MQICARVYQFDWALRVAVSPFHRVIVLAGPADTTGSLWQTLAKLLIFFCLLGPSFKRSKCMSPMHNE
jgi:hypothetical protein